MQNGPKFSSELLIYVCNLILPREQKTVEVSVQAEHEADFMASVQKATRYAVLQTNSVSSTAS